MLARNAGSASGGARMLRHPSSPSGQPPGSLLKPAQRTASGPSPASQARITLLPSPRTTAAAVAAAHRSYGTEGPGADESCPWPHTGHGRRDRLDLNELARVAEDDAAEQGARRVVLAELRPDSVPGRH